MTMCKVQIVLLQFILFRKPVQYSWILTLLFMGNVVACNSLFVITMIIVTFIISKGSAHGSWKQDQDNQ